MKVTCPFCLGNAKITSSNSLTDTSSVKDLYCSCSNTDICGATFVSTLSYKHVITPPAKSAVEIAMNMVNQLSEEEKKALLQQHLL